MLKKFLSIICAACMLIGSFPAAYAEGEDASLLAVGEITLSPADGSVLSENPTSFTATADGFTSFIFELDGKTLGVSEEGRIAAPEALYYGVHELVCIGVKADGSAVRTVSNFTYEKRVTLTKLEENFNAYDGSFASVDFKTTNNALPISTENSPGKTGEEGDLAIGVGYNAADDGTGNFPGGSQYGVTWNALNYNFKSGYYEYEYDIRLKEIGNTQIYSFGPHLWSSDYMLIKLLNNGKTMWSDDISELTDTLWHNVKVQVDVKNKKVSAFLDGVKLVSDKELADTAYATYNKMEIRVFQKENVDSEEKRSAFWLDNIKFTHTLISSGIKKIVYTESGVEAADSSVIPVDAEAVKVYLNDALDAGGFDATKISMKTADDEKIELTSVTYDADEQAIICVPKAQLPSDTDIFVTLVPGLKLGDGSKLVGDYKGRFTTGNPNVEVSAAFKIGGSKDLYSTSQLKAGDVISYTGTAKNISTQEKDMLYVLTVRKNGRLVSMDTQTITDLSAGGTASLNLSLPALSENGNYEIYLMNCTDFTQRTALSRFIKIN